MELRKHSSVLSVILVISREPEGSEGTSNQPSKGVELVKQLEDQESYSIIYLQNPTKEEIEQGIPTLVQELIERLNSKKKEQ